jgi:hypothetical protein
MNPHKENAAERQILSEIVGLFSSLVPLRPPEGTGATCSITPGSGDRCAETALGALSLQANASEKLDPGDDESGTPDHHVERLKGLLLAGREPCDSLDQELQIGFDRPEIDILRITPWHQRVVIIWHGDVDARSWLTSGYDEG